MNRFKELRKMSEPDSLQFLKDFSSLGIYPTTPVDASSIRIEEETNLMDCTDNNNNNIDSDDLRNYMKAKYSLIEATRVCTERGRNILNVLASGELTRFKNQSNNRVDPMPGKIQYLMEVCKRNNEDFENFQKMISSTFSDNPTFRINYLIEALTYLRECCNFVNENHHNELSTTTTLSVNELLQFKLKWLEPLFKFFSYSDMTFHQIVNIHNESKYRMELMSQQGATFGFYSHGNIHSALESEMDIRRAFIIPHLVDPVDCDISFLFDSHNFNVFSFYVECHNFADHGCYSLETIEGLCSLFALIFDRVSRRYYAKIKIHSPWVVDYIISIAEKDTLRSFPMWKETWFGWDFVCEPQWYHTRRAYHQYWALLNRNALNPHCEGVRYLNEHQELLQLYKKPEEELRELARQQKLQDNNKENHPSNKIQKTTEKKTKSSVQKTEKILKDVTNAFKTRLGGIGQ